MVINNCKTTITIINVKKEDMEPMNVGEMVIERCTSYFVMLGRKAQGKAMPAKMPPPTGRERKICTNDPSHDPQWSRCLDTLLLKVWRLYVGGKAWGGRSFHRLLVRCINDCEYLLILGLES